MSYYLGVDIGSLTTKVVLLDAAGTVVGKALDRSGYSGREVANQLIKKLLKAYNLDHDKITTTVATGYGRVTFPAQREVSEITCQARGIAHLYSTARTVIDIGGQDSKVIKMLPGGKVADFTMNDKCAAGTGRFLEVMAGALEEKVENLGYLSQQSTECCSISSICTVFAESEIISYITAGHSKPAIVAGVCDSVAARVAAMTSRTGLEPQVVFTGGVAKNQGVVDALARQLKQKLIVPEEPAITAALGAALFAKKIGGK